MDIESLVNGFVRDSHRSVIRKVGLQPVGNLFGRPTINPFTITAMRLVSSYERRRPRPRNVTTISIANLALQMILNVVVQPLISHQFRRLGSSSCLVSCDHIPRRSMPLFRAKAVLDELIAGFPPRSPSHRSTSSRRSTA